MSENNLQTQLETALASIESLSAKNRELLAELKAAKAKARGAEIDPAEHEAVIAERDALAEKLSKAEKGAKADAERAAAALAEKDGALSRHLIDAGLSDALAKAGVLPQLMDGARAMLRAGAAVKADAGVYGAFIGDKPLAQAVAEWAAGDVGKWYVAGGGNSGGGAPGSRGGDGVVNPWAKESFNLTQQIQLTKTKPELAAQLKAAAGIK